MRRRPALAWAECRTREGGLAGRRAGCDNLRPRPSAVAARATEGGVEMGKQGGDGEAGRSVDRRGGDGHRLDEGGRGRGGALVEMAEAGDGRRDEFFTFLIQVEEEGECAS